MYKTFSLPNLFFISKIKTKPQFLAKQKKSVLTQFLSLILAAANIVLLFSYLQGVNSYSSSGYETKKIQSRISELSEENKKLNFKLSESVSMVAIQAEFLNANFVSAGTPIFLETSQFSQK